MVGDTFILAHSWLGHIFCEQFVAFRMWLIAFLLVRLCDSITIFFLWLMSFIFLSHEHVHSSICMRPVWCTRLWLCMLLLLLLLIQYYRVCIFFLRKMWFTTVPLRQFMRFYIRSVRECVNERINFPMKSWMTKPEAKMKCNDFSRENCVFALKAFRANKSLMCRTKNGANSMVSLTHIEVEAGTLFFSLYFSCSFSLCLLLFGCFCYWKECNLC